MNHEANKWDWPFQHNDGMVNILNEKDRFSCDLEMPNFKAKEVEVKVMKDRELVIYCSQHLGNDRLPREIHRTYHLPHDVDVRTVKTTLGEDGMLHVAAKKLAN